MKMVHVKTFQSKKRHDPSLLYCKFKGEQFAPHYLPCDEMKAYHLDLKELVLSQADNKLILQKINSAKMHTAPIPSLVQKIDLSTLKQKNGLLTLQGKNSTGSFWIEFPTYSLKASKDPLKVRVQRYFDELSSTAQKYDNYLEFTKAYHSPQKTN